MNKIIKIFFISMTAIALTLSGRPPAMIYADQPGTPSGMGTMEGGGTAYKRLGYSLMYSGYTTSVANGDSAVTLSTDTDESSYYDYEPKIINDGGTLRYLRGSRYVPKAGGGWTWNNQEVTVTPAGFTRNNLVRGRSLLDNMYLEPNINRDTLDKNLANGGTAWLNGILSVRTKENGHATMYPLRLWDEGKANFNVPARVYTTSAGVLAAAGWSAGTQKAIPKQFDIEVAMPKIDDTPPDITFNPYSDGTWRNYTRTVTATAKDAGSGVKRMRWRIETNGSWGGWSQWYNKASLSINLSNTGKQRVQVQATDNFGTTGNTGSATSGYFHIDKTAPGGSISASPTAWTNGNVTLTFTGTDSGGSGVRRVRQSGGSWVNGSKTTRTVTGNGTYSFEVEDRAGNRKTVSREVTNIDKTAPTANAPVIHDARYVSENDYWYKPGDSLRVDISGSDSHSGIKYSYLRLYKSGSDNRAQYIWGTSVFSQFRSSTYSSISKGSVLENSTRKRYRFNASVKPNSDNQDLGVYSYFTDVAGNTIGYINSGKRIRVDGTAPTVSASPSSSAWGNTNANVSLTYSDSRSGVQTKQYAWSTSTATPTSWSNYTSQVSQANDGVWFLHYRTVDNVGNVRTGYFGPYLVDKTNPNGTISGNPTSWTNQNVTLTFNATDTGGSGVKRVRVAGGTWVNGSTTTQTATANGTYSFEVEDNAGNTQTVPVKVDRIDKDAPNGTITGNPTSWQNTDATLTFNATDRGSGVRRVRFAGRLASGKWVDGDTWVNGSTMTHTVTGNGQYKFEVEDNAGNTKTVYTTVTRIDKDRPAIALNHSPSTWTNGNVTTTFRVSDFGRAPNYAGLRRLRMRPQGGSWSSWSNYGAETELSSAWFEKTRTITSNGTYEVQVEDRAGNTSSRTFTVDWIDREAPNGTITGNPTSWQNTDATLTFNATDTGGSGVRRVRAAGGEWVDGSTTTQTATANGTYSFEVEDNAGNTQTVSVKVDRIDKTLPNASSSQSPTGWTNGNVYITWTASATGSPLSRIRTHDGSTWGDWTAISGMVRTQTQTVSSNGTYHFQVEDQAGNVRQFSHTVSNIDKGSPDIRSSQTPTDWTNGNVTLTLEARDFGELDNQSTHISGIVSIQVKRPNGITWSDTYGASSENSSSYYDRTFTATENGTYVVTVTDRAGNTATHKHTVTNIDRMPPATSGSFTPDGWTNETITITWLAERTGDPGAPLDAYRYDRGNGDWTDWQNATHDDAFTVTQDVTENGVYSFEIRDKAGNVASSSVTVSQHDIVLPVGQITARFDRSERDDHVDYTSDDLVDMIDSNRVTVDVTGVEDLGISGVDFVTIEEQRRIGYGSDWMTVREIDYDWPDPYDTTSQTYDIDVAYAQDTRFILTVTDRAGNSSTRVASNVVRQSVLQFIDFRITDVVNPQLSEEELADIRASDFEGVVELTAGTNVTFDVTYQLRHLDTVDELSGEFKMTTISYDRTDTDTIQVEEDTTGHNQHVTFTTTFTVPQGAPKGSEITIGGNLEAKLANGTTHKITYPGENNLGNQGTDTLGEVGSHIEEFFRFRIVR